VRPSVGPRNLAAICPLDIQAVYQELIERSLSARTIQYTHSVLRSSMRQAIGWRLLPQDPTDCAQLPRVRRHEMQVLTAEQSRLFLEITMQTEYGPVFALALTTAARPSEYLALKWQDINWERGTVSIARTLERVSGGWRFAETKRACSWRVIKLQGWVLGVLNRLHAKTNSEPEMQILGWGNRTDLEDTEGTAHRFGQARDRAQVNSARGRPSDDPALRSPALGRNTCSGGWCPTQGRF
jgi:integrase